MNVWTFSGGKCFKCLFKENTTFHKNLDIRNSQRRCSGIRKNRFQLLLTWCTKWDAKFILVLVLFRILCSIFVFCCFYRENFVLHGPSCAKANYFACSPTNIFYHMIFYSKSSNRLMAFKSIRYKWNLNSWWFSEDKHTGCVKRCISRNTYNFLFDS